MRSVIMAVGVVLAVPAAASSATGRAQPAAPSERPLLAVSCVSSTYCVAVGSDESADGGDGGPLAETWNGRAWAAAGVKLPAGALGGALFGVSCKSQKSCVAVGDDLLKNDNFPERDNTGALAESWNGKTWTAAQPPVPAAPRRRRSAACPARRHGLRRDRRLHQG